VTGKSFNYAYHLHCLISPSDPDPDMKAHGHSHLRQLLTISSSFSSAKGQSTTCRSLHCHWYRLLLAGSGRNGVAPSSSKTRRPGPWWCSRMFRFHLPDWEHSKRVPVVRTMFSHRTRVSRSMPRPTLTTVSCSSRSMHPYFYTDHPKLSVIS
jgi:hypothetical protein